MDVKLVFPACCAVIERQLKDAVTGLDVMAVPKAHEAMVRSCRNRGVRE